MIMFASGGSVGALAGGFKAVINASKDEPVLLDAFSAAGELLMPD